MTIASGIAKSLRYKLETAWGSPTYPTEPGASGAQLLRRKTSDLSLVKATLESDELRSDYQVADIRHGVRSVEGSISGELSCKTYQDFMRAALRQPTGWTTAVTTGAKSTIAALADGFTDSGNAWLTSGFKIGMICRASGFAPTDNNARNMLIVAATANKITCVPLDGGTITPDTAGDSVTILGFKFLTAPTTGHADLSFALEHHFSDLDMTELFLGCKVNSIDLKIPGNDKATIDLSFMGKDMKTANAGSAPYFTSPTAETTTGILTCLNGALYYGGNAVANVTNADIKIEGGYTAADPVLGSTSLAAVFPGRIRVSGQLSCYWENATFRDAFLNETTASLILALASGSTGTAQAMSIMLPKIKLNGSAKDDGEKGLMQTIPFIALLDDAGGASAATPLSTIQICDTEAV